MTYTKEQVKALVKVSATCPIFVLMACLVAVILTGCGVPLRIHQSAVDMAEKTGELKGQDTVWPLLESCLEKLPKEEKNHE